MAFEACLRDKSQPDINLGSDSVVCERRPHYLDNLNPTQYEAVQTTNGPLLVLAGAGTGKTRVLTSRIAHIMASIKVNRASDCFDQNHDSLDLFHQDYVDPSCDNLVRSHQILAVTFTNKAAADMRSRLAQITNMSIERMWLGTFHALALRMLRANSHVLGFEPGFSILDSDDQMRLVRQIIKAENLDDKKIEPKMVASAINRYKDQGFLPHQAIPRHTQDVVPGLYAIYQERLKVLNSMDFGDLLLHCITLFCQNNDILARYQQQFHYILVDEYQDTNTVQYRWLNLLAQGHKNICCVGDDDQSIYSWRGAEIGNILRFEQDYANAKVIRLEQNYRSTGHILGAASGLIAHNQHRLGKTLWTSDHDGHKVLIRGAWDSPKEARLIGDMIERLHQGAHKLRDIAVLVRASFQTREIEERFLNIGIPYRVIGGLKFYERQEIRDAIAYLRLLMYPNDSLAFERIINVPKRGIGSTTIQKIQHISRDRQIPIPQAAWIFATEDPGRATGKVKLIEFFQGFERWRQMINNDHPAHIAGTILDESGYTAMWKADKSPDSQGRLENLKEFIHAIEDFGHLSGFLDHVSLVMDHQDNNVEDQVSMMTLHGAKGLEFSTVFLPGWEEGIFPHPRCLQESGKEGLEEERRLGYVGISRARQRSIITYALSRYSNYQGWSNATPSRFLAELPKAHIDHLHANGKRIS